MLPDIVTFMRRLPVIFLLSCFFLNVSHALDSNAAPTLAAPVCADKKELKAQVAQRAVSLEDTLSKLSTFLLGQDLVDVPPAALFSVDLNDEQAVQKRKADLTRILQTTDAKEVDSEQLQALSACAAQYPEFAENVTKLHGLSIAIASSRLEFLSLPQERRTALISAQGSIQLHAENAIELELERTQAETQKTEAAKSMEVAQELAKTAKSVDLRELASQRALLENYRKELASLNEQWVKSLQDRAIFYKSTAENLLAVNGVISGGQPQQSMRKAYDEAVVMWRLMVGHIFTRIADPDRYEPVPAPPAIASDLLKRLTGDPQAEEYQKVYTETHNNYLSLINTRKARFDEERDNSYRLLLEAGKLRSELLRRTVESGDETPYSFSGQYLKDLSLEVRIVPYQWIAIVYSKILDFRQKLASGIDGWVSITEQTFFILFLIAVPFAFLYVIRRATHYLDVLRRNLVRRQFSQSRTRKTWSGTLALWLQRFYPYAQWVLSLIGLWLAEYLLSFTALAELALLLPYIEFYVWYRIIANLLASMFGVVAYQDAFQRLASVKQRIQVTAKRISLFFIIVFAIMHATEDVVGRALVSELLNNFMLYVGAFVCFLSAYQWRKEIGASAELYLSDNVSEWVKHRCAGRFDYVFALPCFVLVILASQLGTAFEMVSEVDFFKRIGAELFRRRIESAVTKNNSGAKATAALPDVYTAFFDLKAASDPKLLIEPTNGFLKELNTVIENWVSGSLTESSIAMYGDKGSGKSTTLELIKLHAENYRIVHVAIPPKLFTRESVTHFFSQALGVDLDNGMSPLTELAPNGEKTIVFVDEAQNLFLGKLGGFEGYKVFLDFVNSGAPNVFWISVFNRVSWTYLQGVFPKQNYFSYVYEVPPFDELDIQNLIMTRHKCTSYRLSYDAIIRATENADEFTVVEQIESQFFRLLWGQSKGNPRAAMVLWQSALTMTRTGVLKVGIPLYKPVRGLELLSDDTMFVFAAILRHENLSASEAEKVTSFPAGTIREALKTGFEYGLITGGSDGRYRVTPTVQSSLMQFLMGKNFIYE